MDTLRRRQPGTVLALLAILGASSLAQEAAQSGGRPWSAGLADPDPKRRAQCVAAAAEEGAPADLDRVLPLLGDENSAVREQAARAVVKLGARDQVLKVMTYLKHANPRVREAALLVFGIMGEPKAEWQITWRFAIGERLNDADGDVRARAAWALARMGAKGHVTQTLPLIQNEKATVRAVALLALSVIGSDAVARLLREGDAGTRTLAAEALGHMGARSLAPAVAALLKDRDAVVRLTAVMALARIGSEEQLGELTPLLKDESLAVREMAAWAVDALSPRGPVEAQ